MNNIINIENRIGKLRLNDSVSKDSADQLIQELEQLYGEDAVVSNMKIGDITCSAENALESVDVEINSPGGSVFEGQRIYNALKGISSRGVEVTTTVNGLAASMGSVILMAGDVRKMTQGSRIMIHEASTMTWGDARQLKKQSQILESISSEIAEIYAERSNGSQEEIRDLMRDETWMTANEAEEAGFVDMIIKDGKSKGKEADAANKLNSPQSTTTQKLMFKSDKDLKAKFEASQAEVTEHEATIVKREAEAVTLSEDLTEAKAELEENQTKITDLESKLEASGTEAKDAKASQVKAESDLKDVEAKAKTDIEAVEAKQEGFDKKVADGVVSAVAALGHATPLNQNGDNNDNKVDKSKLHGTARIVAEYQETSPIK